MPLYVPRRLFVVGGILFFAIWYFLTFLCSVICTSIYISGTLGYLYRHTRKEVRHQLGLVRTRRKGKQTLTQSLNQTINSECNHVNSFTDCYNNSNVAWESHSVGVKCRNLQTAAGPLLINYTKGKDLTIADASKTSKYNYNSLRYKAPALSNAMRMTATARRRYPINQERYSLIGQLPIVQLNKEPLPILKNFNTTMMHNPVTVKIAPPEDYKRSNSRWKFVYSSSENVKSRNDPCDARTVIAALKENRKRSSKDKDDITVESINTKRQRRDSSSSSGSAFMPTNSSPAGTTLAGNPESASLNIQKCPNNPNTFSPTSRNKRPRNNAITSSYSSSKRLMEKVDNSLIHQLAKRKAAAMDTSTPKKLIKVSDSRNEELAQQKNRNVKNTSQFDQSMESEKTIEGVQNLSSNTSATSPLKKGASYRRNLSLYTSLGTPIQAAPMPAHLPTLEEHEKDKKIEAKRLEWLLSGVNEAFQGKDGVTTMNENTVSVISSSASSTVTNIPNIISDNKLNNPFPVSISDSPITSTSDLFNKVVASSSLTLFGSSTTSTTTAPTTADTQVSFLSSQPSNTTISPETTISTTKSLLPSTAFSLASQGEKVTSVDSLFGSFSGSLTTSPSSTLPQISLSSSTATTASLSPPISSSLVKPSTASYSIAFPSSTVFSSATSKQKCDSSVVASSSASSGLTTPSILPTVTIDSLSKPTTTISGGFTFNLQPSSSAFPSGTQSSRHSSSGFNFPLTTASNVVKSNLGNKSETSKIVTVTDTITSPSISIAVTSSHPSFHVTSSLVISPSNGLVTTTASVASTTSQPLFALETSSKPFIFGSTNEQKQPLFGNPIQPQTELTATQNDKTVFKGFNSQVPLVPPSIVTVASSNQATSNSFLSSSAMISPNQNATIFGTGSSNAFASNITNPFGTNSQSPGFGQNQTVFASPNTAASQHQAPNFGSNQGTFVSGSTSQSAFMTSGQMQPVLGTTNAFNTTTSMQNTFGTAPASAPFQFGTNTGNFNFNFNTPTKYNYGVVPSFGTPAPTPGGSALFSIGSGKLDRKTSSSRRRLAKK